MCQLIEKLVDWDALGMEVVAVAENGIEALEKIKEFHPDIVITDIRMPGYDGLDLIRLGKEEAPKAEFVIISGYRHFEYAQMAIRYGVNAYLLKPIRKDDYSVLHIDRNSIIHESPSTFHSLLQSTEIPRSIA